MSTENIICFECGKDHEIAKKEYNRQVRRGRTRFWCSLSCSAHTKRKEGLMKGNWDHLKEMEPWNKGKSHPLKYHLRKCKQRSHEVDITLEYLERIWDKQAGRCALTGIELVHWEYHNKNLPHTASLDRIDSSKGYVCGNIQFVCYSLNLAKSTFTNEEFSEFLVKFTSPVPYKKSGSL